MPDEITIKRNEFVTLLEIKRANIYREIDDLQDKLSELSEEIYKIDRQIEALTE